MKARRVGPRGAVIGYVSRSLTQRSSSASAWHLPELRVTAAALQNRCEPGDHDIAAALVETLAGALTDG